MGDHPPSKHCRYRWAPFDTSGVCCHAGRSQQREWRCRKDGHLRIVCIATKTTFVNMGQNILQSRCTCWIPAICLVIYSTVTGSSTVKRWLWHSIRALSINTRPSAVRPRNLYQYSRLRNKDVCHTPANARQTWSSSMTTLRTVRGSWSCKIDFFSTPKTTTSFPRTPTAQVPFRTASRAYSTYVSQTMKPWRYVKWRGATNLEQVSVRRENSESCELTLSNFRIANS